MEAVGMLGRGKVQREERVNAEVLEQEHNGNRRSGCSWRSVNEGAGKQQVRWSRVPLG